MAHSGNKQMSEATRTRVGGSSSRRSVGSAAKLSSALLLLPLVSSPAAIPPLAPIHTPQLDAAHPPAREKAQTSRASSEWPAAQPQRKGAELLDRAQRKAEGARRTAASAVSAATIIKRHSRCHRTENVCIYQWLFCHSHSSHAHGAGFKGSLLKKRRNFDQTKLLCVCQHETRQRAHNKWRGRGKGASRLGQLQQPGHTRNREPRR